MALISLREAQDLGLLDPKLYPDLFSPEGLRGPGGARFPANFGSNVPFFRLPGLTGLRSLRFGLEPLALRLGLSPLPSALTAGPGAVPVGRARGAAASLTPAQQLEVVRRRIEEGVLDPRSLPAEVRAALARTSGVAPRAIIPAQAGPPGGAAELAMARRVIGDLRSAEGLLNPPAAITRGPISPESEAAFQAQRTGERADLSGAGQRFIPDVPGAEGGPGAFGAIPAAEGGAQGLRTLGTPTGIPEFAPGVPEVGLTSESLLAAQRAERELPEATGRAGDLLEGVGPALSGLATAGSLASAGLGFANENPAAGALGLASAAGSIPALAKAFPEATKALGATNLVTSASPFLKGLGAAGGLAGAGLGFARGDPAGGALGLVGTAGMFLPPPYNIVVPLISAIASLFTGGKGGGGGKVDVQVPGYAFPISQTAGGAQTSFKSFQEGQGAVGPFQKAVSEAKTPDELVAAFNRQYSPFPGQFQVYATEPGGTAQSIRNFNAGPSTRRFTLEDLSNPDVVGSIGVQAGAMGAPAEMTKFAQSLREFLPTKLAEVSRVSEAALPPPTPAGLSPVPGLNPNPEFDPNRGYTPEQLNPLYAIGIGPDGQPIFGPPPPTSGRPPFHVSPGGDAILLGAPSAGAAAP